MLEDPDIYDFDKFYDQKEEKQQQLII